MSVLAPEQYAVYLITDNPSRYAGDFLENVEAAVAGGVTLVQYRDKESDGRRLYERCLRLRRMLRERGIPLCVNNLPGLALAVDAEAVHVGQEDMPPEAVRRAVGRRMDIGWSVTCASEARAVDRTLVDAVGIGPVFDARATKADAADAMGLAGLEEIVRLCSGLATVAVGGVARAPLVAVGETRQPAPHIRALRRHHPVEQRASRQGQEQGEEEKGFFH